MQEWAWSCDGCKCYDWARSPFRANRQEAAGAVQQSDQWWSGSSSAVGGQKPHDDVSLDDHSTPGSRLTVPHVQNRPFPLYELHDNFIIVCAGQCVPASASACGSGWRSQHRHWTVIVRDLQQLCQQTVTSFVFNCLEFQNEEAPDVSQYCDVVLLRINKGLLPCFPASAAHGATAVRQPQRRRHRCLKLQEILGWGHGG